jgi:hypothetical protein
MKRHQYHFGMPVKNKFNSTQDTGNLTQGTEPRILLIYLFLQIKFTPENKTNPWDIRRSSLDFDLGEEGRLCPLGSLTIGDRSDQSQAQFLCSQLKIAFWSEMK